MKVAVAPYWNVNGYTSGRTDYIPVVAVAPYWNVNAELQNTIQTLTMVAVAPYWNVNPLTLLIVILSSELQ